MSFMQDLESLINKHCVENESDTPDFILAQYIGRCLDNWNETTYKRDKWWGFKTWSNNESIEDNELHGQPPVVLEERGNDSTVPR